MAGCWENSWIYASKNLLVSKTSKQLSTGTRCSADFKVPCAIINILQQGYVWYDMVNYFFSNFKFSERFWFSDFSTNSCFQMNGMLPRKCVMNTWTQWARFICPTSKLTSAEWWDYRFALFYVGVKPIESLRLFEISWKHFIASQLKFEWMWLWSIESLKRVQRRSIWWCLLTW